MPVCARSGRVRVLPHPLPYLPRFGETLGAADVQQESAPGEVERRTVPARLDFSTGHDAGCNPAGGLQIAV
jgi:hypothetical protein